MQIEVHVKQYHWHVIGAILVSALGYFVDLYDLFIFNVVRTESLTSLGVSQRDLLSVGISILDWTFTGMVLGGVIWGMLGDRLCRLKVLFGSIIIYSLANLANELVEDEGKIARVFRFALSLLAEQDRAQNERMKPQTEKAIQP